MGMIRFDWPDFTERSLRFRFLHNHLQIFFMFLDGGFGEGGIIKNKVGPWL